MHLIVIDFKSNENKNIKIPVLMYHDFTEQIPSEDPFNFEYINTPEHFEENIKALLKHGFKSISFKELYDAKTKIKSIPKKSFIITFDDGYESQYTLIYPLIKKYKLKATIFVVTDFVGKEVNGSRYFGWDAARKMQYGGFVKICSHGKRHIAYDTIPINEFKNDILQSFEILDENIGRSALKIFAYPYGIYNQDMVGILKQKGIDIQADGLGIDTLNTLDLSLIKRINIPYRMTGEEIIKNI